MAFVRGGDPTAFEILYDRHARELLSFCRYMLGSHADAEDAVQSTFASAHKALLANDRTVELRPWLFAIARNACLSIMRVRRPLAELSTGSPLNEDAATEVEQREEMREVMATLLELPESQRVALVLAELYGFSQSEIGAVLGVDAGRIKSYIYQARSNLISEREARGADCDAIRQELAAARGPALLKSRLRRHLRSCPGCQQYAAELSRRRDQLGVLLPVLPSLALKRRVLEAALGNSPDASTYAGAAAAGGSVAATTVELAGGGAKALVAKLLAGVAFLGAGTGAATVVVSATVAPAEQMAAASRSSRVAEPSATPVVGSSTPAAGSHPGPPSTGGREQPSQTATPLTEHSAASRDGAPTAPGVDSTTYVAIVPASDAGTEAHGRSEEAHGSSEEAHGKGEEAHGKSEEAHGQGEEAHGNSEEAHGQGEEAHGKSEEAHGKSEEAHGNSEGVHGQSEEAAARGNSEGVHGQSEEAAARGNSEGVHGHSEEAAARGKSEEAHGQSEEAVAHGKSEEAHGQSEEAVAHGKSEEAHGNGNGP